MDKKKDNKNDKTFIVIRPKDESSIDRKSTV